MPDESAPPPLPPRESGGCSLGSIVAVVLVLLVVAAIALPGLLMSSRASNERNASASLKTLSSAQTDFRSNDRDGDRAQNFWVYDVYSLHAMCPSTDGIHHAPAPGPGDMIKLVEPSIGAADGGGRPIPPGVLPVSSSVGSFDPKASYCFLALAQYESGGVVQAYGRSDAGNIVAYNGIAAYNHAKFGFMAAPVNPVRGSRLCFFVNEDNTIWKLDPGRSYAPTYAPGKITMTGLGINLVVKELPSAAGWSKLD